MLANNYARIVTLLQQTQTQEVKQAEKELFHLAQQDPDFADYLVAILKANNDTSDKIATAAYLNSAICENVFQKTPEQYATIIANLLADPAIDPAYKRIMERSVVSTIDGIQDPHLTELRELVFILLKDQRLRDTAYMLIACFCIPESVDIQHIIYLTKTFMMETLGRLVLPNSPSSMYLLKEYNEILKTWVVAWDRLSSYDKIQTKKGKDQQKDNKELVVGDESKLLLSICEAEQFSCVILQVYEWFSQSPIYICTHNQLYELNLLKQSASELHYRALAFTRKKGQQTKILEMSSRIIGNVFSSLALAASNPKMLDQLECRSFVTNLLMVARYFIWCRPSYISSDWKEIIRTVVFPFMRYDEEDLATFEESPEDFLALFEDCGEKQTFGIIKTEACKLLEKISDLSEKITQNIFVIDFIINFSVDSIKNSLGQAPQNPYGIEFIKFDTAITAICVFSFRMERHRNKLTQLRHSFNKQVALGMNPYQRSLMYLFLAYNYSEVYTNPADGTFWIELALSNHMHPSQHHCAIDLLFNIADQYYSDYFVQQIGNMLVFETNAMLFDAVAKLMRTQATRVSPALMLEVIQKIYERLCIELKNAEKSDVKQTLIAIKLINIISTLATQKDYCNQNEDVKNELWKVTGLLDFARKMKFDSEVYAVVFTLIQQEDHISSTSKQFLGTILSDFAADDYYENYFYQILNLFISKPSFDVIPSILKTVNTGIIYHVLAKGGTLKKTQRRLILSHLLILQQNILAYHGNSLTETNIVEIGSICMNFMPQENQASISPVIQARALNVLLLCHLYYKTEVVIQYLLAYYEKEIYFNYDIRVLLACIQEEVLKEQDVNTCAQLVTVGANVITIFRKRQRMDAAAKKIKAKYGKDNRLKLVKYKQFEVILKKITTPFNSDKKLETLLNQLIENVKQKQPEKFRVIVQCLPEKQNNLICQLCGLREGGLMGSRRPIYTVLKPKAPEAVEVEESDHIDASQDEEQNDFKRQRIEAKKTKKNKNSKNKKGDDEEMQ